MRKRMMLSSATLIATLFVAVACPSARTADENMYEASPAELVGEPGTIIRVAPMPGLAVAGTAHRVLYRSRGLSDEPIAVSGVVIVPSGLPPEGGRDVIAWGHPTTGVVQACAPSQRAQMIVGIPGLADMLARGYLVAATDYPGLGTPGPHPYLIGMSEGRAVLDAVRAARALSEANAGRRFAVWGHSQGGHAALYAGELARSYAPELDLRGVAAAAPATFLADLVDRDLGTAKGRILGAMALYYIVRSYSAIRWTASWSRPPCRRSRGQRNDASRRRCKRSWPSLSSFRCSGIF